MCIRDRYTTVYTLAFDGHVGRSRVLNPAPLYFFETYHQSNWCCSECRVMKTLFLSHEKHEKTVKICWCSECRVMKTLLLSHEKTVWNEVRTNNVGRDDATHTRYVRPKNWKIPSQKRTCIQQCTCLLVMVKFLKHTKKELLSFQSGDLNNYYFEVYAFLIFFVHDKHSNTKWCSWQSLHKTTMKHSSSFQPKIKN